MMPLTLDDLLPLQEYVDRRREFFEAMGRYLDRYRRVRVGPKATLLFENRQTLWYRIHEILRIARLTDEQRLQQELDFYNELLPSCNRLQAALLIHIEEESKVTEELEAWRSFEGQHLQLKIGDASVPAEIVTCRPEDLCLGAAHWVQFDFEDVMREHFNDLSLPALIEFRLPEYQFQSDLLTDDVRQSLLEDLELSDRDEKEAA